MQATLLNGTEGTRLILTSRKTGAEHAIKVVASGGDGGLRGSELRSERHDEPDEKDQAQRRAR